MRVVFPVLAAFAVWPPLVLNGSAGDQPGSTHPQLVSVNSLIPADPRVAPMPLAERSRRGAVPSRGMCSTIPATAADRELRLDTSEVLHSGPPPTPAKGRTTIRIADGRGQPLHLINPGAEALHSNVTSMRTIWCCNPALTTMHNPYAILSPDPQGGLPTLIIEMLVYSRPGVIGLLPAQPDSLSQGELKGVLFRTQARIGDLKWNLKTGKVDVTISSRVDQTVALFVRKGIETVDAPPGVLVSRVLRGAEKCEVRLNKDRPVTVHFDIGHVDRLAWVADAPH